MVGERLLYLPSVGFCLLLSVGYFHTAVHFSGARTARATTAVSRWTTGRWVMEAGLGTLCGWYAAETYARNPVWASTETLFAHHVKSAPRSVRMHHGLAGLLAARGNHTGAVGHYRTALRLLGEAGFRNGLRPSEDQDVDQEALYLWELGSSLHEAGALAEAADEYRRAVALRPGEYRYHNRLAFALVQAGRYSEGWHHFDACYRLRPNASDMVNNLGNAYMAMGQPLQALRAYRLARRLRPDDVDNLFNMGVLLMRISGHANAALATLAAAVRLNPAEDSFRQAFLAARSAASRTTAASLGPQVTDGAGPHRRRNKGRKS